MNGNLSTRERHWLRPWLDGSGWWYWTSSILVGVLFTAALVAVMWNA